MLREVGRNCQDVGAGFGSKEGNCELRLIRGWYVEGVYGRVGVFVYCEYGAPRAAVSVLVVEGRVVD